MNEAVRDHLATARSNGISATGRFVVVAFGLAGVAIGFLLIGPDRTEPLMLGLLGLLAVVGVAAMLAAAFGLIRFVGRGREQNVGQAVLDAMIDGIVITDRSGRLTYANPAYAALIGVEDIADVRAVDRVFAADAGAAEAVYRIAQQLRDGRPGREEIRLPAALDGALRESGVARWYRIEARPLGDGPSQSGEAIWTVVDISGERDRQETVFQELQHAIDYLDHAPVGFFSAEPDGRIVYINATLAGWLGIDIAQFDSGSLALNDIVSGESAALLAQARTGGENGRSEVIDLDLVRQNGQSLPVRLLHRVPVTADGAPGATRTAVLNRAPGEETSTASEALRASEVRFARFFNSTPIAIAAIDENGRIGRSNAPFLKLFGHAMDGKGDRLADLVIDADRPVIESALASAKSGIARIPPIDATLVGAGERSARFYVNPVDDGGDGEESAIINAIDITEQRVLEQQVAQSQKMETVGKLAGGIAHDFNNVLTAIIGFSDLLLANHRPSDPSFQDIMNIKQNANRAAGLVRQLLAFSRRQTLRPQVLQISDLISDITILLNRLIGEDVKLEVHHGHGLWPIKADLNQLEQVVINLAVNGRDAMPEGGSMTIRTCNVLASEVDALGHHPLPAAEYVLLEVEDTGTGMSPDVQRRVFEPFFSTKEIGKGTGLGLSTVYGIVKQSGAYIFVDSEEGRGTTFRVFFPRHVPTEEEETAEKAEEGAEIADLTGTATILLVEDEEAVRAFAARALASRGYEVYEASSGVEALDVMEEAGGQIDLVVSDVVMPELDGPSLLRELRQTRPELKIIFVSGYAEDAFKKNLPEGEDFRFLPKPFSLKELAVAVKETLGR
ncbi:cell cycle histidine kinase CckA [Bauldia sp.]|uniref:cell cycle histidine kinase CckA n=1 Tax=Bauldia sp. TaxID=2575872 RepID=UPI003BADBB71